MGGEIKEELGNKLNKYAVIIYLPQWHCTLPECAVCKHNLGLETSQNF